MLCLFFGFAAGLFLSCIMLLINSARDSSRLYNEMEAVVISENTDDDKSKSYEHIEQTVAVSESDYYSDSAVNYGFTALDTEAKQELYLKIQDNIYAITDEPDSNGRYHTARLRVNGSRITEFDIREVVNAFLYDRPQVFWIENMYGYAYSGDDTILELYSVMSAEECEKRIEKFNSRMEQILSSVGPGLSEYEREKLVHDLVLKNCSYKKGVQSSDDGWEYFTAYGALVSGESVCEGYAKSMQILLSKVGIPCYTIRGEGENVAHIWNVVYLGGEWYHLDATWDDNEDAISYEYFNINSEQLLKNHIISDDIKIVREAYNKGEVTEAEKYNFFVPMCTSRVMNYYNCEGCLIERFDTATDSAMISLLIRQAKSGAQYVPVRFGCEMSYNDYMTQLFYESPYKFYYYIDHANEQLDEQHRIDKHNVSVLKNEAAMTLRVKIAFTADTAEE